MTERLYYTDAYCTTFDAQVVERLSLNARPAIVLDRSAFYPTGGGQPHDTGTLNGISVVDVVEQAENRAVIHILASDGPENSLQPGDYVRGEINWTRRFDHMQQHTGQHLLSQAFIQVAEADTVGFHLSDTYSTIDLGHASLSEDSVARAEALANQIIFENRPVLARFLEPDEVATLPLRKTPPARQSIRVVQVEGFDWSACGGTHVKRTGEIGLVKVVRSERRGAETRITFLCGQRALAHYHMLNVLTRDLALSLSVGVEDLPEAIERLNSEARSARKERDRLSELLLDYEAATLTTSAQVIGPVSLVCKEFEMREMEQVRRLAMRITNQPGHVVLLGVKGKKAQLIFARSADLDYDMRPLLRGACGLVGGGGGGGPELAQGGGSQPEHIGEALAHAAELLRQQIKRDGDV
ncbi:MAG: DHHA1 domain-containing protein [Anaerolineae bacterium]